MLPAPRSLGDVVSDNKPVTIRYERLGDLVRLTLTNVTNHELREVLIGLWTRLDDADRADHRKALEHYTSDTEAFLSPVAAAIKVGGNKGLALDLLELINRGEKIRP